VLHGHDGEFGGAVARWAVSAEPGSPVGLLDQGLLFDPPEDAAEFVLLGDETGLPALRGILASLPADASGVALLEVPQPGDAAEVTAPAGVRVEWLARNGHGGVPGQLALAALESLAPRPDAYAFVVGESGLATGGRRALKKAGLPVSRITFSGFWKA
jgi:NADPH-dependent ferric siderophore reductase